MSIDFYIHNPRTKELFELGKAYNWCDPGEAKPAELEDPGNFDLLYLGEPDKLPGRLLAYMTAHAWKSESAWGPATEAYAQEWARRMIAFVGDTPVTELRLAYDTAGLPEDAVETCGRYLGDCGYTKYLEGAMFTIWINDASHQYHPLAVEGHPSISAIMVAALVGRGGGVTVALGDPLDSTFRRELGPSEAVPVKDGMRFYVYPTGSYGRSQ